MTLASLRCTKRSTVTSTATAGAAPRRDQVDDAVADVFLTVWRRIDEVPPGETCLPWIYGVAFRVLSDQWRGASRRSRLKKRLAAVGIDAVTTPEEFIVTRHESRQVLEALALLKTTDQEILRLASWEELAHSDIAAALDISVGAVRQRLYEARKRLTREYNRLEKKHNPSPAAQKGGAW